MQSLVRPRNVLVGRGSSHSLLWDAAKLEGFQKRSPMTKRPLHSLAILLSAFTCLCACSSAYSATPAKDASPSDQPSPRSANPPALSTETATIPGPLRSFMRMAAISQKVYSRRCAAVAGSQRLHAGLSEAASQPSSCCCWIATSSRPENFRSWPETSNTIRVRSCDDAGTLVQILGYRLREGCGSKNFFLETANPERAFLTIDSGFPAH